MSRSPSLKAGVFLDRASVDRGDLDLRALFSCLPEWRDYPSTGVSEVAARIADAEVILTNKVVLDQAALAKTHRLKLICVTATGVNNIDLNAALAKGIVVCNVRDYATASVVQHVFGLILCLTRRLMDYQRAVTEGRWARSSHFCLLDYPVAELAGKRLGIVGYGVLGQAVARMAEHFGMQVLVAERVGGAPRPGRVGFEEMLAEADIITLHCPLNAETSGLFNREVLRKMQPGSVLINAARGGIVDEHALLEVLEQGPLAAAGIDVLETEPPTSSSPLLIKSLSNLLVTPHIAWASREARQRLMDEVLLNIREYLQGKPRNAVGNQV